MRYGIIHGNNAETGLGNSAGSGASLYSTGNSMHGTFTDGFTPLGSLQTADGTINVENGLLQLTGTVGITGTAEVGQTLTADTGALGGSGIITYQWKRGSTNTGTNGSTYEVQAADVGSTITVTVTRAGFTGNVTSAPTETVLVPGNTLAAQLEWLRGNAQSGTGYTLVVKADESLAPQDLPVGKTGLTVSLKGNGKMRTITLSVTGSIFTVRSGVTLVLDGNITLQGRTDNYSPLVRVLSQGTLVMNGNTRITGNYSGDSGLDNYGGGVYNGGTFIMNGGEISGNQALITGGGGVFNAQLASLTMNAGKILGNSAGSGGGVLNHGTFGMSGGEISDNQASGSSTGIGGGVFNSGVFVMGGGEISGNRASGSTTSYGGGVNSDGTFVMSGGEISGNKVLGSDNSYGGGVNVGYNTIFQMSSGVIYGSNGPGNANSAPSGGAIYVGGRAAQHGTFDDAGAFTPLGNLETSDTTIKVVNGLLQ